MPVTSDTIRLKKKKVVFSVLMLLGSVNFRNNLLSFCLSALCSNSEQRYWHGQCNFLAHVLQNSAERF